MPGPKDRLITILQDATLKTSIIPGKSGDTRAENVRKDITILPEYKPLFDLLNNEDLKKIPNIETIQNDINNAYYNLLTNSKHYTDTFQDKQKNFTLHINFLKTAINDSASFDDGKKNTLISNIDQQYENIIEAAHKKLKDERAFLDFRNDTTANYMAFNSDRYAKFNATYLENDNSNEANVIKQFVTNLVTSTKNLEEYLKEAEDNPNYSTLPIKERIELVFDVCKEINANRYIMQSLFLGTENQNAPDTVNSLISLYKNNIKRFSKAINDCKKRIESKYDNPENVVLNSSSSNVEKPIVEDIVYNLYKDIIIKSDPAGNNANPNYKAMCNMLCNHCNNISLSMGIRIKNIASPQTRLKYFSAELKELSEQNIAFLQDALKDLNSLPTITEKDVIQKNLLKQHYEGCLAILIRNKKDIEELIRQAGGDLRNEKFFSTISLKLIEFEAITKRNLPLLKLKQKFFKEQFDITTITDSFNSMGIRNLEINDKITSLIQDLIIQNLTPNEVIERFISVYKKISSLKIEAVDANTLEHVVKELTDIKSTIQSYASDKNKTDLQKIINTTKIEFYKLDSKTKSLERHKNNIETQFTECEKYLNTLESCLPKEGANKIKEFINSNKARLQELQRQYKIAKDSELHWDLISTVMAPIEVEMNNKVTLLKSLFIGQTNSLNTPDQIKSLIAVYNNDIQEFKKIIDNNDIEFNKYNDTHKNTIAKFAAAKDDQHCVSDNTLEQIDAVFKKQINAWRSPSNAEYDTKIQPILNCYPLMPGEPDNKRDMEEFIYPAKKDERIKKENESLLLELKKQGVKRINSALSELKAIRENNKFDKIKTDDIQEVEEGLRGSINKINNLTVPEKYIFTPKNVKVAEAIENAISICHENYIFQYQIISRYSSYIQKQINHKVDFETEFCKIITEGTKRNKKEPNQFEFLKLQFALNVIIPKDLDALNKKEHFNSLPIECLRASDEEDDLISTLFNGISAVALTKRAVLSDYFLKEINTSTELTQEQKEKLLTQVNEALKQIDLLKKTNKEGQTTRPSSKASGDKDGAILETIKVVDGQPIQESKVEANPPSASQPENVGLSSTTTTTTLEEVREKCRAGIMALTESINQITRSSTIREEGFINKFPASSNQVHEQQGIFRTLYETLATNYGTIPFNKTALLKLKTQIEIAQQDVNDFNELMGIIYTLHNNSVKILEQDSSINIDEKLNELLQEFAKKTEGKENDFKEKCKEFNTHLIKLYDKYINANASMLYIPTTSVKEMVTTIGKFESLFVPNISAHSASSESAVEAPDTSLEPIKKEINEVNPSVARSLLTSDKVNESRATSTLTTSTKNIDIARASKSDEWMMLDPVNLLSQKSLDEGKFFKQPELTYLATHAKVEQNIASHNKLRVTSNKEGAIENLYRAIASVQNGVPFRIKVRLKDFDAKNTKELQAKLSNTFPVSNLVNFVHDAETECVDLCGIGRNIDIKYDRNDGQRINSNSSEQRRNTNLLPKILDASNLTYSSEQSDAVRKWLEGNQKHSTSKKRSEQYKISSDYDADDERENEKASTRHKSNTTMGTTITNINFI